MYIEKVLHQYSTRWRGGERERNIYLHFPVPDKPFL